MLLDGPFERFAFAGIGLHNSPGRPGPDFLGSPPRADHGSIGVWTARFAPKVAWTGFVDVRAFFHTHQQQVFLKLAAIFVVGCVDPIDAIIESTCAADTDAVPKLEVSANAT